MLGASISEYLHVEECNFFQIFQLVQNPSPNELKTSPKHDRRERGKEPWMNLHRRQIFE